ncbi:uncharacterized protein LOC123527961 [Mercenaria mercenaria]|uniref:uncharacterized protein LOC123527961 n=1 Tax=Mercenaria mercenaria TaxID=6596 RepID=UPI00234EDCE3|nr:uncharacterized protein LOC123527961 [Mercenaria mercenaria]
MTILKHLRLIVFSALFVEINSSSVLKSNGTSGKELNPQTLIAFGRETNDSLVTMIGKVIENYHMCTAWSQWTECGATRADFFSARTRRRHCVKDKSRNGRRTEIETGVCEGGLLNVCPRSYNMTVNGFCIKLYTTEKTHNEAENVCKNDGGFLINIDSDPKYFDVKAILISNDMKGHVHIDGRRKNASSQWEYSYGSRSGYFHWYSGYPTTRADHLCLELSGYQTVANQRFLTFNGACSAAYSFLCEVQV